MSPGHQQLQQQPLVREKHHEECSQNVWIPSMLQTYSADLMLAGMVFLMFCMIYKFKIK